MSIESAPPLPPLTPLSRRDILKSASFGSRVAEEENDQLESYFVETKQWSKLLNGSIDIVFGPKGAGKSALYSLLVKQKEHLRLQRRIIVLAAENTRGSPIFRDLTIVPAPTEEQLRAMWKLYFLCIVAEYARHALRDLKITFPPAEGVFSILTNNKLLPPSGGTLTQKLRAVMEYIQKRLPSLEATITEPNSGIALSGKITFAEPTSEQRSLGYRSIDDLIETINRSMKQVDIKAWLVLDRLDVAFADSPDLEANALRALFRCYLDFSSHDWFCLKIFLRNDIWSKIVAEGFREASHVTRNVTITWDQPALVNLIVRRLLNNNSICKYYDVDPATVLNNSNEQVKFFDRVFPDQIGAGQKRPKTIDWMLSRTADGSRQTAPRELIHLLLESQDQQIKLYELGGSEPPEPWLFERNAISSAVPEVSRARYAQTLCAENPNLKPFMDKLERGKTQHTSATLAALWGIPAEEATEKAEALTEVGFFERKETRTSTAYHVPFLYRDALKLKQGSA